jgi:hypothetical protein
MVAKSLRFKVSAPSPAEAQAQVNKWLMGFERKPVVSDAVIAIEEWEDCLFTVITIDFNLSPIADDDARTREIRILAIKSEIQSGVIVQFLDASEKKNSDEFIVQLSNTVESGAGYYAEAIFVARFLP